MLLPSFIKPFLRILCLCYMSHIYINIPKSLKDSRYQLMNVLEIKYLYFYLNNVYFLVMPSSMWNKIITLSQCDPYVCTNVKLYAWESRRCNLIYLHFRYLLTRQLTRKRKYALWNVSSTKMQLACWLQQECDKVIRTHTV